MSLQVTSNPISPTSTDLNGGGVSGVGDAANNTQSTGSGVQLPPQYQLNFGGLTRALGLGLSSPSSVGDVEILFARIASELKETLNEVGSLERIGRSEARRGQLGLAMAGFEQMLRYGAEIDLNRLNIKKQEAIIAEEGQKLLQQQGELGSLQGSRGSLVDQRTQKETERDQLVAQNKPENAARITQLNSEISTLNLQIGSLDRDISAKEAEIKSTQDKIGAAQDSKRKSENRVTTVLGEMATFFGNIVELLILALGGVKSENARDSAIVQTESDDFEALLSRVASALVDLGEALNDATEGQNMAEQSVGSGLNLEQSSPDRFGQASAPVARAMAFAGMVAGVMGAIADLLRNVSAGMATQSAGSFASAGESRVRVPV